MAERREKKLAGPAGNTLAGRLARLGLRRDIDFVLHLPLRYEDETRITAVSDALPGVAAQFEVVVVSCDLVFRPRRQLVVRVQDESGTRDSGTLDNGTLTLRFLNFYPSQQKVLQPGARLRVFGELRDGFLGNEIIHPRFHVVASSDAGSAALPTSLTPVYPTTAGLGQATLRRLIDRALTRGDLTDTLPADELAKLGLPAFSDAVRLLHAPPPGCVLEQLESRHHPAWRRVQFDELLAQQLSLRRAYTARRARGAPQLEANGTLTQQLLAVLPFRLTGAQQRAWHEIAGDLAQPHPMQRLLQGDVGSGKTIVAALAMLHAVEAGYQAALMAPTEILAEQHYRKLSVWLAPLGIEVAWLTGSLKKRDKAVVLEKVGAGETALMIGTHALIEEGVMFHRLGLAIVDEQHRFGVRQRLALKEKGRFAHQLTMSATPIPRTLAMSYYADLDVSVLDELPPGRTPVSTRLVSATRRAEIIARVRAACRAGGQAYWVCPLITESETLQLQTAEDTFAQLLADLPDFRIGLVHGRLKGEEKAAVMAAFAANQIHVLVATTVIEVGVDVPNASLMIIEHAERFGLSQLHQLRGRVGRGAAQSVCILLYAQPLGQIARARLKVIFQSTDGFEIAREDLRLRGPGEFIGARQSGLPLLRYADLEDTALVEQARQLADTLLRETPAIAQAHLDRWLDGREELLKA
ncbi:MAG: ATP-dependent DNA helicase RecG [Rugosibacter sp.]|nr:ATP-dependent DNA helicase RecG [Rugosibacter sp.]